MIAVLQQIEQRVRDAFPGWNILPTETYAWEHEGDHEFVIRFPVQRGLRLQETARLAEKGERRLHYLSSEIGILGRELAKALSDDAVGELVDGRIAETRIGLRDCCRGLVRPD